MSNSPIIELHYYLAGDAHSMDAVIRNRCEAELLAIFQDVAARLGVSVDIEALALSEGGVREAWKWLGENAPQIGVILAIVTIIITVVPKPDTEQDILNKDLTRLSIEEKSLQIEKLRRELRELDPRVEEVFRVDAVHALNGEPKIVVRRSNFYKLLSSCQKVKEVGVTPFIEANDPILLEKKVNCKDFHKFVLRTNKLHSIVIENANIEIVSPVLREGNYKWKGIFKDQLIGFYMQDYDFKKQVLMEEITFQHGTYIECVLNVNQKLNEVGEVEVTGYVVTTVLRKYDDRQFIETRQGNRYRRSKQIRESQQDLFKSDEI